MAESEPWAYHPDGSPVLSLADIIRRRAAITPALVALAEPGRLTSFADLDRRSSQVAQALQRKGVARGDRVAFVGASGPEFAEVLYGAAKCGTIFTAVNNRLAPREVLAILADAEPAIVIVDPAAAPLVADSSCDTLIADLDYLAWRDASPPHDPGELAGPDETALILYTSGTTGTPKGVELTGRNLGCALHELHAGIDPVTLTDRLVGERGEVLVAGSRIVPRRGHIRSLPGPHRLRQAPKAGHPFQPRLPPHPLAANQRTWSSPAECCYINAMTGPRRFRGNTLACGLLRELFHGHMEPGGWYYGSRQGRVVALLPFDPVPFAEELRPGRQPVAEELLLVRGREVEIGRVVPGRIHEDRP